MKFETNYSGARTIRGRELIQGRGSRCANYLRVCTNRGCELYGLLGYSSAAINRADMVYVFPFFVGE